MTREEHIPQRPQSETADDEGIAIEGLILEELPSLTQGSKMLKAGKRILHIYNMVVLSEARYCDQPLSGQSFEEQIYVFRGVSRPPSQYLHHT